MSPKKRSSEARALDREGHGARRAREVSDAEDSRRSSAGVIGPVDARGQVLGPRHDGGGEVVEGEHARADPGGGEGARDAKTSRRRDLDLRIHVRAAGKAEARMEDPLDLVDGHFAGGAEHGVGAVEGLDRAGGMEPAEGAGQIERVDRDAARRIEAEAGREPGHDRLGAGQLEHRAPGLERR